MTDKYQGDKQINLSMAENPENKFFTSLTDQHYDYLRPKEDVEELIRDNEINFIQAAQANKDGPFKYLGRD